MTAKDRESPPERPAGGAARLGGAHAVAAAGPTLFAPFAATLLTVNGAPWATATITALSAAPLAAIAMAAAGGSVRAGAVALATLPIAFGAVWTAWVTGGAASPALAWMFAAAIGVGLFGGRRGPIYAALLAASLAALLIFLPEPSVNYAPFRPIDERELIAMLSWAAAMASAAAAVWAALGAWEAALPPLRHPTILARQALGRLSEDAAACALRIGPEGRVLQAIGAVERALDLPRDEIKGLPLAEILHPDDVAAASDRLANAQGAPAGGAAKTGSAGGDVAAATAAAAPEPLTVRVRSRMGGYRWVEGRFVSADGFPAPPGPAEKGQTVLVLRQRWRPLQEDLAPADPARSAFLAQMSAGLKDELTEVVGYAEIMKGELFGPLGGERYREYARLAHDSGARLLERLEELLDLASLEAGARLATEELADATPLIDGAVRLTRSKAEAAGVSVKADIAADAPHVRIDRRALRRVLVAALLDAVRRTPIGDAVRLKVEAEDGAMRFAIFAEPRSDGEAGREDRAALAGDAATRSGSDDAARFGRLVAESLVERLGGAIAFHDGADGAGLPLVDLMLPIDPPTTLSGVEGRPRPAARTPSAAPPPTGSDASSARRAGEALRRALPSLGGARSAPPAPEPKPATSPEKTSALVAAPRYDDDDEEDATPLTAERQTEMARKFAEDLKREAAAASVPAPGPAVAEPSADASAKDMVATPAVGETAAAKKKASDDVDLPLFEPEPPRRADGAGD